MKYSIRTYYVDFPLVEERVFDVFEPDEITKESAIFIVHGGGWRAGSRHGKQKIMEELCLRGYLVGTTDYRLDAKDGFEQISDIRASYDKFVWLLKEKKRPLKIAVYGESAGAHLGSLMALTNPGELGEENNLINEWVKPSKLMLQSTPMSFIPNESITPTINDRIQDVAGAPYEENPEVYERLSIKNYIREDNPPIFFMEAELEKMFKSEQTKDVCEKHRTMGIESKRKVYKDMDHGFFFNLTMEAQKQALEDICDFIEGKEISARFSV